MCLAACPSCQSAIYNALLSKLVCLHESPLLKHVISFGDVEASLSFSCSFLFISLCTIVLKACFC